MVNIHIPLGIRPMRMSTTMKSFRRHLFERTAQRGLGARCGHDMPSPTMTSFRLICAAREVNVSDEGTREWQSSARESGRPLLSRIAPSRRIGRRPYTTEWCTGFLAVSAAEQPRRVWLYLYIQIRRTALDDVIWSEAG